MDNFDFENDDNKLGGDVTSPFIGSAEGGNCGCGVDGGYDGSYTGGGMLTDMLDFSKDRGLCWGNARAFLAALSVLLILLMVIFLAVGYQTTALPVIVVTVIGSAMAVDGLIRFGVVNP
jgi:hypothetical protein